MSVKIRALNGDYEKLPHRIRSKNCQGGWGRDSERPLGFVEIFTFMKLSISLTCLQKHTVCPYLSQKNLAQNLTPHLSSIHFSIILASTFKSPTSVSSLRFVTKMYVLFSLIRFVLRVPTHCLEQGWKETVKDVK